MRPRDKREERQNRTINLSAMSCTAAAPGVRVPGPDHDDSVLPEPQARLLSGLPVSPGGPGTFKFRVGIVNIFGSCCGEPARVMARIVRVEKPKITAEQKRPSHKFAAKRISTVMGILSLFGLPLLAILMNW